MGLDSRSTVAVARRLSHGRKEQTSGVGYSNSTTVKRPYICSGFGSPERGPIGSYSNCQSPEVQSAAVRRARRPPAHPLGGFEIGMDSCGQRRTVPPSCRTRRLAPRATSALKMGWPSRSTPKMPPPAVSPSNRPKLLAPESHDCYDAASGRSGLLFRRESGDSK